MSKDSVVSPDEPILSDFREKMGLFADAVEVHKMAPPDQNFSTRLAALAQGASELARVCRAAHAAGLSWPPARKAELPYELRPGTGRRGPQDLWLRFDHATTRLSTAAARTDLGELGDAYEQVAEVAGELAGAVGAEDRAGGSRARRAA